MYNIYCSLPKNREPWNIPLLERKKLFFDAKSQGKRVAAMLYHHADTSTFRYRCYNLFQATQSSNLWQSIYFFAEEIEDLRSALPQCDLLIFVRMKWEHALDELALDARKLAIPLLYDIDDLVCDLHYLKMVTNTLNVHFGSEVDYDFWFAYFSRMQQAASLAEGFITTNAYLGSRLSERFQRPYQIIPNSLNREQLAVSEQCVKDKRRKTGRHPFTIGYFSGTPSHINDFKVVSAEFVQLLNDNPEMNLRVVGFMEFPDAMQPLIRQKRIVFTPLVDFLELQRLMAEVDVSVVPLVSNTFTNCKSELKFFEASVVDTVTLASPSYNYSRAIKDGETGFLCNSGQWYDRVISVYQNPDKCKNIVNSAKEYCLQQYSGEVFISQIEEAYSYFSK